MLTMQTRFRTVFVALGSLLVASSAWGQAAPVPAAAEPPAEPEAEPAPADAAPPADAEPAQPAPSELPPAPPTGAATAAPNLGGLPAWPEPNADAAALQNMNRERTAPARPGEETSVFADDWWSHARPVLELHGALRVRWEMLYRFSLGRTDIPAESLWPRPPDAPYNHGENPVYESKFCTADEAGRGSSTDTSNLVGCRNNTQSGANLRFRLNPEIHISDNLRIVSQVDLLDNVVFGSTGGYDTASSSPELYRPFGVAPQSTVYSGANSIADAIRVKRAWGEYATPVGELRFGRMPNHWGLGIVNNAGDGYDDDSQSTIDRIQFVAGIKPLDLYLSGAWDFPNEGASANSQSQAFDAAQLDDVTQYVVSVARRKSPELVKLALTRGNVVVNGGLQLTYRQQLLEQSPGNGTTVGGIAFTRRDAWYWLPDLWTQVLYKQFRFELEAATVQGRIGNVNADAANLRSFRISQWGLAAELELKLVENRLGLGLGFGWASGDGDSTSLVPQAPAASGELPTGQLGGDRTISEFRFNPAYRVDLILNRNILSRVQGTYYFRPSLSYDFVHDSGGQRMGGAFAGVWTRASQFIQAPGHERDLGIELNASVYFQSKDGALNDDPNRMGGFLARIDYGVLFPMAGMGSGATDPVQVDLSHAMILRAHLGVQF